MAINKIVYGGRTLMDLTGDTATPENVEEGVTFHDASGTQRSGTLPRTVSADNVFFSDGENFQQKYDEGELTGPAGYTPVRGTDYWTTEDQNDIVSQAVTQIQPDISDLKSDISAEKTAREQSDTSLQQEISGKLPKSPADWEPWTAEEQAVARERIGASKKLGIWEDIANVNINEDAAAITVNLDSNGNTFSLSDIICEITIPVENPAKQRNIYFGLKISTNFTFSRTALTTNTSYISGAITYARIVSGRVICDGAISGPSNTRYQPYQKYAIFNGNGGIAAESFDTVSVFTYSDAFPAGTTVALKGIRT